MHRISPIRDDNKLIVGLTVRVAQHIPGAAAALKDVLIAEENRYKSVLLVGTARGREDDDLTRHLGHPLSRRRLRLGRSGGGLFGRDRQEQDECQIPCIGFARRMQIPHDMTQADVLMLAVRNHGPSVIIADEVGYESDAEVIATIAQRGVKVIATGHGTRLSDIAGNKHLKGLVGHPDALQKRRMSEPVFQQALEIRRRGEFYFHPDVAASVDALLEGREPPGMWISQQAYR